MNAKTILRIGAAALVVLAVAAAAIELGRDRDAASPTASSVEQGVTTPHALQHEVYRCQALGGAGARDEACLRAWAESRRRFLGGSGQDVKDPSSAPEAE